MSFLNPYSGSEMMKKFNDLQRQHENFLRKQIINELSLADVQTLLKEIVISSKNISSIGERNQLRSNLS